MDKVYLIYTLMVIGGFIFGYAVATAKHGCKNNIGTLWVDNQMPENKPLLYLELREDVDYFQDDKEVLMDVRIVQDTAPTRD